ncbi:DUF6716 putative glycosyltransferase [Salinactinospora qingdaonensis]|uniref:Uncharacterized protein n=1 Tax=Salinactinospora qingdaonensis TaxID=702744 RepID=A0ABP7G2W1_9ACTN
MTERGDVHVLAIADSDSYLKWAAGLLDGLPAGWSGELAVVRTPIAPSASQMRAAVQGTRVQESPPQVLSAHALRRSLRRNRPDAVVLACTGPVVDVLVNSVLGDLRPRPVFVSGLPGISVPATQKAWLYRGQVDLFVVHSTHEVADFRDVGAEVGATGSVALATLPFLSGSPAPGADGSGPAPTDVAREGARATGDPLPGTAVTGQRNRVVFATQAKVPVERDERVAILRALTALAANRPELDVVVKLRARAHEQQTHREHHHYETLWQELVAAGEVEAGVVTFADGSMRDHLAHAVGFVTVSSTAALEAITHEVPLLVLSDFGVSAEMINLVFEDSGTLGTLDDLRHGRFNHPSPQWCAANYFHSPAANDWAECLAKLVEQRRTGALPDRPALLNAPADVAARRRARLRLEVPPSTLRTIGRMRKRVRKILS